MPVYICKNGPVTVRFGYDYFTFANNQIVNTKFPQIGNHPNFELVSDTRVAKRAPPVHLIKPLPSRTVMMTTEDIINELREYGANPDPYELSDKLAYQLDMVRQLYKRTYITVLDDNGNPMWLEEYKKLENKLIEKARKQNPVNTPEVKIAKEEDVAEGTDEYKLATASDVKKEGGSIGAVEYNDEYELTDECNVDELIRQKLDNRFETPVEKVKEEKDSIFKEDDIAIKDEDITIDNFTHIIEVDVLCANEVSESEKRTIREINYRNLGVIQCGIFLKNRGIVVDNFEKDATGIQKAWVVRNKVKDYINNHSNKEECIIELNLLQKRIDEIDKIAPSNIRKFTLKGLKRRLTLLNKYGVECQYKSDMTIQDMRGYMVKALLIAKIGIELPKDDAELKKKLETYSLKYLAEDIINTK